MKSHSISRRKWWLAGGHPVASCLFVCSNLMHVVCFQRLHPAMVRWGLAHRIQRVPCGELNPVILKSPPIGGWSPHDQYVIIIITRGPARQPRGRVQTPTIFSITANGPSNCIAARNLRFGQRSVEQPTMCKYEASSADLGPLSKCLFVF
jgi:hypothetical protein